MGALRETSMKSPETVPLPTPELVMIGIMIEAHLSTLSRKERLRFLSRISESVECLTKLEGVTRIRPEGQIAELAIARRGAAAWWNRVSPLLTYRCERT